MPAVGVALQPHELALDARAAPSSAVRGGRDRVVERRDRVAHAARLEQRGAERGEQRGVVGHERERALQQRDGGGRVLALGGAPGGGGEVVGRQPGRGGVLSPSSRRSSTARSRW